MPKRADFEPLLQAAAEHYGIPLELLAAQIEQESSWEPAAVSHCGARGLMQLMPETGKEMGLVSEMHFFDPERNINAGAGYLKRMYKAVKSFIETLRPRQSLSTDDDLWMLALASYNGGLGYTIAAMNLALKEGLHLRWTSVEPFYAQCQVRGKRPDHKQITEYVNTIMTQYRAATRPTP